MLCVLKERRILKWKKDHRSRGLAHAIVAITCGLIGLLISGLIIASLAMKPYFDSLSPTP